MFQDIFDLLDEIKHRPGAFLGTKSITRLRSFIDGVNVAFVIMNQSFGCSFLKDFESYIEKKYDSHSSLSWCEILLNYTTNNETKAFDLFFEELEAYLNENGIDIPEIK